MASFTSKASGAWDTEGQTTWNEAGHPVAGDTVAIGAHAITCASATACATLTIAASGSLDTTDGETSFDLAISGATEVSGTLTLNDSTVTTTGVTVKDGGTIAVMTANVTNTGALTIGDGASGLVSFAATGHWGNTGAITINAGGVLGTAATAYTFTISATGSVAASAGTWIASTAASNALLVYAGATWRTPTTFTHSSGEVTFLGSGTVTIGNDSTQFYDVQVANFTTVAIGTYAFTTAGVLDIGGGVSGIVTVDTGAVVTIGGTLTIGSGTASFGTADKAYTLDLNGSLSASGGILIAPNATGTFTFSGSSWSCGTFTHSSGSVVFDGTNQAITGSNTWNNFDKHVAAAANFTIDNTSTQTVEGELDLYGAAAQLLTVKSDSAGNAFSLVLTGTKGTIQYLSVKDSDASGSDADVKPIAPTNSVNVSGNTSWFPTAAQPTMQTIVIS